MPLTWSSEVKFARIWDFHLVLLDSGVTTLRAQGGGETEFGANVSLNKLHISPRAAVWMLHDLGQVVDLFWAPVCNP